MRGVPTVFALCLLTVGGCAATRSTHPPIPPYQTEDVPLPPVSAVVVVWQPGHFDWDGANYQWVPGEWVERKSTTWLDGYWDETKPTPVWVPAHWVLNPAQAFKAPARKALDGLPALAQAAT